MIDSQCMKAGQLYKSTLQWLNLLLNFPLFGGISHLFLDFWQFGGGGGGDIFMVLPDERQLLESV